MSIALVAARAPAIKASGIASGSPPSVNTLRLWVASECRSKRRRSCSKAAPSAATASASRPSETFGTARSTAVLHQQLAGADDWFSVERHVGLHHHAVEVHGNLDRAPDRRRGAKGDVGRSEDLLVLEHVAGQDRLLVRADAQLGDAGRLRPVLRE